MVRGNILIINPNQLFREGLKHLLLKARFTISGEGKNFSEAIKKNAHNKPADLVILTLETGSGMEAGLVQIGLIRRDRPSLKLVALAPSLSSAEFLQAMHAGVDAILTHDISSGVLRASLELVLQDQHVFLAPMHRPVAETAADPATQPQAGEPQADPQEERNADHVSNLVPFVPLRPAGVAAARPAPGATLSAEQPATQAVSKREGQILRHLVRGMSNKAIARELELAETTVKAHVKGLMRKVRATNRTQVAIWATHHYFASDEMMAQNPGSAVGLGHSDEARSNAVIKLPDQPRSA